MYLESFLRFVSSEQAHHSDYINEHWKTVHRTCRVCELKIYDLVVQAENSSSDAIELLEILDKEFIGAFPSHKFYHQKSSNSDIIDPKKDPEQHFMEIQRFWRENIPRELTTAVYERYYWDFELFDYSIERFL